MFVRTVLGLMIVQTYKKFLISVPLRKLFCYLYLPNEYFQTDPNMKKLFFPIMFLLAAGSMQAQTYNELVEKAMDYTLKDSLVQAEQLFRQALKMEPGNARNALLFSNLGTVQKRMGKTDEAIESYTMALNITPYSTAMLLNRASLYLDKGLTDKAYLDYCNVIDLLPENQEARMFRAYIYMQRRQYTEARIDYNAVLAKDVRNLTARLGLVMLNLGYFEIAYNENNHLKITEAGRKVLFGHERAQLVVIKREETAPRETGKRKRKAETPVLPILTPAVYENEDEQLFEELRILRKRLADQQAIPAYIVLSDKTLHLLAAQKPQSIEAFGEVSGIGAFKKDRYGKDFVEVINRFLQNR